MTTRLNIQNDRNRRPRKKQDRGPRALVGLGIAGWTISVILSIAFWIAVVLVAIHFIGKFW